MVTSGHYVAYRDQVSVISITPAGMKIVAVKAPDLHPIAAPN